jgi:prophage regulatory protein
MPKLLRLPQVASITGLSKSSIYAKVADGDFPKQISLGSRSVAWLDSHIESWIQSRVAS